MQAKMLQRSCHKAQRDNELPKWLHIDVCRFEIDIPMHHVCVCHRKLHLFARLLKNLPAISSTLDVMNHMHTLDDIVHSQCPGVVVPSMGGVPVE